MYKKILILIMFIGIILIVINLSKAEKTCPQNKIIYRYIPRTLDEEYDSPAHVTDIFKVMFSQSDPWINSITDEMLQKRENINQYFISQY